MSSTPQTLKRLGVATVGALTLLSTPYVGGAVAFAAVPGAAPAPGDVTITSQISGNSSPRNDGTDTTVKVSANVAYSPATGTAANANAAAPGSVRFTYHLAGGTDVLIGDDNTAPYSVQWTPPAGGGTGYRLNAEALDSAGKSYTTPARSVDRTTSVTDASSVHITSPAEGGAIGSFGSSIVVSGTRSADLPAIAVTAQTRNNASGVLSTSGAASNVAAGTPATGADQTWSAIVTVPGCANTTTVDDCNVVITAVATGTGTSDEVTEAKPYAQTLTNFDVSPTSATKPAGASQNYVVTAKDQSGKPFAGLTVSVTDNSSTATESPVAGTTGTNGTFTFAGSNIAAETATYTVQSKVGTNIDPSKDFTRTATLTTYASNPTTPSLTAEPMKALYASQKEYTASTSVASPGTPVVDLCVVDQNGQGTPNSVNPPVNLVVTVTRTTTTGTTTPAPATTTATPVQDTRTGKGNCYLVPHDAASGDSGQDVFNAYYENNGSLGYQAGSSDLAAGALTLKFATLSITGLATQAQKGTATTVSFKVLGADGSPFANRKITLSTPTDSTKGFTATQPSGTTAPTATTPNDVIATTDANGIARATVNSKPTTPPTTGNVDVIVTAKDDVPTATAPDQVPTNVTPLATATVQFRDKSVALAGISISQSCAIVPVASNGVCSPRPGDALPVRFTLRDANNGQVLRNTAVTLTLDRGFFTPDCVNDSSDEQYTKCTFDPARADGAKAGNLKSLGTTKSFTSDPGGYVRTTVAIARDAGFDDNGSVLAQVTGVANGGTFTTKEADDQGIYFSTDGYEPINGGTVSLVPVLSTSTLSGNKQARSVNPKENGDPNLTPVQFAVHVTDQFGNLVRLTSGDVQLSVTGGGLINGSTLGSAQGSYTDTDSNTDQGNVYSLTSATTSTTGQLNTVKATWDVPVTLFKATTTPAAGPTPASTTWTTVDGTRVTKTDSFSVNMYAIDLANLKPVFESKPGNSVPVNTAVTTSATVKDQYGNPVQDLCVRFLRSGPGSQSGEAGANDPIFNECTLRTNPAGKAGYLYSSTSPGTATITVIVSDKSGNELSRGVRNVTFTTGTTANKPSFSLATHVISAGQSDRLVVRGTPGQTVQVLAYSLPSTTYKVVRTGTLSSAGTKVFYVTPATNSRIYVRSAAGQAASQHITVKAALTLAASAKGRVATFTGKVSPAVVGRTVTIYYIKGGKAVAAGSAKVAKGGTYTFSRTFAAPGQKISFFAQTTKDSLNASGRSLTRQITFGR